MFKKALIKTFHSVRQAKIRFIMAKQTQANIYHLDTFS